MLGEHYLQILNLCKALQVLDLQVNPATIGINYFFS